jgi:hypothetical protein
MTKDKNITKYEMDKILSEYSVFRKLFERDNGGYPTFENPSYYEVNDDGNSEFCGRCSVKLFEIRRFVNSLPVGDERVLLFLHYIHGETLEKCAERMLLSRRSVYRLHRCALELAAAHYYEYKKISKASKTYE